MSTALHEQARTTPHARARGNGVTAPTLYQWKRRTEVQTGCTGCTAFKRP